MNPPAHKCKRITQGDYEYRGFAVYINPDMQPGYVGRWHVGVGQRVHSEATQAGCLHWIDNNLAGAGNGAAA